MTTHLALILLAGLALMGTFLLPGLLRNRLLSLPIIYVSFGFLVFNLPLELPLMNPEDKQLDRQFMEYFTELIVIISLAGTGLKMRRSPGWKSWASGAYLLGIAMPITIAAIAVIAWGWIGLAPASAILLGAVMAPTDPVLAANVQVGPPKDDGADDEVRFGLTLEAGLNDGLAFPFVYLAIALVTATDITSSLTTWAWWDFGYRIVVGTLVGYVMGKALLKLFSYFRNHMAARYDTEVEAGFFILASVLLTYACAEVVEGYGFLAVFVAAATSVQQKESDVKAQQASYEAIDQVEQAALGFFLIAFGGIIATGGLSDLTWQGTLLGIVIILVIRPLSGLIAFIPSKLNPVEKVAISYFGIRGVGSLYYLAYAHNSDNFPEIDTVWSIVNFTILVSIFLHGLSVKPVLNWVDRKMGRV
ncbi:sodium:proton antiporter [Neolewinella aurantiaca]|uniref:Sodium:proton antiporter n=1 Tax=Neolewinella aurantiaca TaxID=2602767 RepID=A0A5C7FPZ6_9BACT|nr:cation:proton antiporter [Neolewinella aurantiaca]TXF89820.1 sodium:proton antiporter [Neolewinella aurantiaca]